VTSFFSLSSPTYKEIQRRILHCDICRTFYVKCLFVSDIKVKMFDKLPVKKDKGGALNNTGGRRGP
jgi:hypothetical protein